MNSRQFHDISGTYGDNCRQLVGFARQTSDTTLETPQCSPAPPSSDYVAVSTPQRQPHPPSLRAEDSRGSDSGIYETSRNAFPESAGDWQHCCPNGHGCSDPTEPVFPMQMFLHPKAPPLDDPTQPVHPQQQQQQYQHLVTTPASSPGYWECQTPPSLVITTNPQFQNSYSRNSFGVYTQSTDTTSQTPHCSYSQPSTSTDFLAVQTQQEANHQYPLLPYLQTEYDNNIADSGVNDAQNNESMSVMDGWQYYNPSTDISTDMATPAFPPEMSQHPATQPISISQQLPLQEHPIVVPSPSSGYWAYQAQPSEFPATRYSTQIQQHQQSQQRPQLFNSGYASTLSSYNENDNVDGGSSWAQLPPIPQPHLQPRMQPPQSHQMPCNIAQTFPPHQPLQQQQQLLLITPPSQQQEDFYLRASLTRHPETIAPVYQQTALARSAPVLTNPMEGSPTATSTTGKQGRTGYRRARTVFTPEQIETMETLYSETVHPDFCLREVIGSRLNLSETRVQVWFKNRRAKSRIQNLNAGKH